MNNKGVSLTELAITVTIFALFLGITVPIISTLSNKKNHLDFDKGSHDLLQRKTAHLLQLGYWPWNIDTQDPMFPENPYDPAVIWEKELLESGAYQGTIDIVFLKHTETTWEPFETMPFDGENSREVIEIYIQIKDQKNKVHTQTIGLSVRPIEPDLRGLSLIMKQALQIYYVEFGAYPAELSELVPVILDEIPNDPFTNTFEKITHVEESIDWAYIRNEESHTISLYAYSHPRSVLSWAY